MPVGDEISAVVGERASSERRGVDMVVVAKVEGERSEEVTGKEFTRPSAGLVSTRVMFILG